MRTPLKLVLIFLLGIVQAFDSQAQVSSFAISNRTGCAPLSVNFASTSTGTITSLSWDLGNGTPSTAPTPSTTYFYPGVYYVTLLVIRPGVTDTVRDSIQVFDKPTLSFSGTNLSGCAFLSVSFSSTVVANSPGVVKYSWDFGDGAGDTLSANPSHIYTTAGNYTVSLTVTNGAGCSRSVTTTGYVHVFPRPQISFSGSGLSFCNTATSTTLFSTSLSSGTQPFSYSWNYGDNSLGLGANPSHHYTQSGLFSVKVLVTDAKGCQDSFYRPNYVFVNDTPAAFSMPPVICSGDSVYFYDTTAHSIGNTHWDFGDGDTAFGMGAAHQYAAGVSAATITMTVHLRNCIKSLTKTLIIYQSPTGTITQTPLIPCPAPSTVTFSANSATALNYQWEWQSGGRDSGQTVAKLYNTFTYMDVVGVIMKDANGCKGRAVKDSIRVPDICVAVKGLKGQGCVPLTDTLIVRLRTTNPDLHSIPNTCNEDYPAAVTITSWKWDLGNGQTSTKARPEATYLTRGDFFPSVVVTTSNNCLDSGVGVIHPDTAVPPSFYASPLNYCPLELIQFHNTSPLTIDDISYIWGIYGSVFGGDTSFTFLNNRNLYYGIRHSGHYNVRLESFHYGCTDTFVQNLYITVNPPEADFTFQNPCAPSQTVVFTNASQNADHYLWVFGDGITDTATNPSHSYVTTGKHIVSLVAYNTQYGCTDTQRHEVEVYYPNHNVTATYNAACTGDLIYFFGHTDYTHDIEFSFIIDSTLQTSFSDGAFTSYAFDRVGFHHVYMVAAYGNNCLDTVSLLQPVLIGHPSIRIISSPPIGCAPLLVTFTDSSTNAPTVPTVSRVWVFAPGDTVLDSQVVHRLYAQRGEYPILLKVTDSLQCESVFRKDTFVSVGTAFASFSASKEAVCKGDSVSFTALGSGRPPLHFDWDFGDGYFDTGTKVGHRYTSMGTFNARLIVTDSIGCADTSIHLISVQSPTASFTQSDSLIICPPQTIHFFNASTGAGTLTYAWDFDLSGGPINGPNPLATFLNPKIYTITLVTSNDFGCTDTARSTVKALGYNGAFSYTPLSGCLPMEVVFTPPIGGIPQITWDFNDGSTIVTGDTLTTHIYTLPGKYVPRVIFSDGKTCKTPSEGLDTITVDKVKADFDWDIPCVGTPFALHEKSSGIFEKPSRFFWLFEKPDTAIGASPQYNFLSSGTHEVTLIVANSKDCKDTISKEVFINPLPLIVASPDRGLCPGDSAIISATGGKSYVWSPANLVSCTSCQSTLVHARDSNTYYYVSGTDSNGCINKDSVLVYIKLNTTDSTGPGGAICMGGQFRLFAEGADLYQWSPAETIDSPFIASPLASPKTSTTYLLIAKEGTCIVDSVHIHVTVHPLPIFSAGQDQIIERGGSAVLHPTQAGIERIEWKPDSSLSCWDCFLPIAHPRYTRTYFATGYDKNGCSATDTVTVFVRCNGDSVFVPNTFSPNGDGHNDVFYPRGEGVDKMMSFRIFNRWGALMFERLNFAVNDESAGWNGRFQGKELPPDVYVYVLQSRCEDGQVIQWKGDVSLMK